MTALEVGLNCIAAGISVMPIALDGHKRPDSSRLPLSEEGQPSWNPLRARVPTDAEVRKWWGGFHYPGIAAVCGEGSGGLEMLDFDCEAQLLWPLWVALVEDQCPDLLARLCVVRSPRPGRHVWWRCPDLDPFPGNLTLATDPSKPAKERTLIQTRGEGGYALIPGCPEGCNAAGLYTFLEGPKLWEMGTISFDEREVLVSCARFLSRKPAAVEVFSGAGKKSGTGKRPGDYFDAHGPDWAEILVPHGWECVYGSPGGERRWRRPGKSGRCWSATTGHCAATKDGADLLKVFTSNADPFECEKAYGKFRAYCLLEHGGDWSAAAKALAGQGYADPEGVSSVSSAATMTGTPTRDTLPKAPPRPYQPFPTEFLPRAVSLFVSEAAAALNCDPAYLALPALAVCAAAIGNSRAIRLKQTWVEPAVIWAVVIGDSGTLKTPAWKLALGPLWDAQDEYRQRYEAARQSFKDAKEERKNRVREARGREGVHIPDEPQPPQMERVLTSDITVERLAELLEENPRGLLVARDELNGWLGSFTRYRAQGSDLPGWLELHSAGVLQVDRKTGDRRQLYVRPATASIAGGIQPGVLSRSFTADCYDAGLAARMLLAYPSRRPKVWTETEVPASVEEGYRNLINRLLRLQMFEAPGLRPGPHRLLLTRDAKSAWVRFYNQWGTRQADAEGELAAAFSKLEGYAARLALIHHICTMADLEADDLRDVGTVSIEAGIALSMWFAQETERVYAALTESEGERTARRLAEWVRGRGGRCTARELRRSSPRRYRVEGSAEQALEILVGAGWGRWVSDPSSEVGGRPSKHFEIVLPYAKTAETPSETDQSEPGQEERSVAETPLPA